MSWKIQETENGVPTVYNERSYDSLEIARKSNYEVAYSWLEFSFRDNIEVCIETKQDFRELSIVALFGSQSYSLARKIIEV